MKDKQTQMWIPLYVDKWIFGSTRIELEPAERSVFIDLLAFGAKDNGYIRANEITAYPHRQLAGLLNIDVSLLDSTIDKCLYFDKITEPTPGIYRLKNWDEYQLSEDYKYRLETGRKTVPGTSVRQNSDCSPKNSDCSPKIPEKLGPIREEKRREEKREHTTTESAKAEGNRPVNWDNCKSDTQRIVARYVKLGQPALYAHATQSQANALFKVQGKAVGPILAQCGDIQTALRVVELAAQYYAKKGLDWSLYAVSKNCGDFLNTAIKEKTHGSRC